MPVIHPRISESFRPAQQIIEDMVKAQDQRRILLISRDTWLKRYSRLRKELEQTPEYRRFLNRVRSRNGRLCERCCKERIDHVHHKRRMAMYPKLAMEDSNAEGLCTACHRAEHPENKGMHR